MSKKNSKPQPKAEVSDRPIIESIALTRTSEGWVVLNYFIQGTRVLAVEASDPNIIGVGKGVFKVQAGRILSDGSEVSKERWQELDSRQRKGG